MFWWQTSRRFLSSTIHSFEDGHFYFECLSKIFDRLNILLFKDTKLLVLVVNLNTLMSLRSSATDIKKFDQWNGSEDVSFKQVK